MSNARNLADLISGTFDIPVAAGSIGTTELTDLGVTAGKLAGTLDLSGKTLTLPSGLIEPPTTAQVLSATAGLTAGAIGTYALLALTTAASTITAGTTYSGADLRYAAAATDGLASHINGGAAAWGAVVGTSTWRAVGSGTAGEGEYPITLFVRIS